MGGSALDVVLLGQPLPTTLEFNTPAEREDWARFIKLAAEVLTPEADRAAQGAARASHLQQEIEERRALNEERKKKLSQNLGMKFTAEAMMARGSSSDAGRGSR